MPDNETIIARLKCQVFALSKLATEYQPWVVIHSQWLQSGYYAKTTFGTHVYWTPGDACDARDALVNKHQDNGWQVMTMHDALKMTLEGMMTDPPRERTI